MLASSWVNAEPVVGLDSIAELSRQGAEQFALKLLQDQQPDFITSPQQWYEWETLRLQVLERRADWAGIIVRQRGYPNGMDANFALWAQELSIKAYLESGQGQRARHQLAGLLWAASAPTAEAVQRYREWVIRSLLLEGETEAAHLALLRYQQDYPQQSVDIQLLRGEVLIAAARYPDALIQLAPIKTEQAEAMGLLAQVRYQAKLSNTQRQRLRWLASQVSLNTEVRYLAWTAQAEYEQATGDLRAAVLAAEQALIVRPQHAVVTLVSDPAGRLWRLYQQTAVQLGNRERLLQGEDATWLALAQALREEEPVEARALYAQLALTGQESGLRERAHTELIEHLLALPGGDQVVSVLYGPARDGHEVAEASWRARYFFADRALALGDVATASRYLAHLDTPPGGEDRNLWDLRRARVLIMAGKVEEGVVILRQLQAGPTPLQGPTLDRYMQVVFDLQTVQAHAAAIELFSGLLQRSPSLSLQRELHFWLADSYRAQGAYETATLHYLQSAALSGGGEGELWAQSAKYQAAQSLAAAGMVEDARELYTQLLKATDDKNRQAILRHEMQTLLLKQVEMERAHK